MKRFNNFSGLKTKSSDNLTGYEPKSDSNIHEPFFVQALLNPKKNDLLYVMDSCLAIISEKKLFTLYDRALKELVKLLHAEKGAFYLYKEINDSFSIIGSNNITESELKDWEEINLSIKRELRVTPNAFYGVSADKQVDTNTLIVPVRYNKKLYAVVKLSQREGLRKFSKFDIDVASQINKYINSAIEIIKRPQGKKAASSADDSSLRMNDNKTFKLSYFYEYISSELRRARRYNKTFSLIYFKINNHSELADRFKEETIDKAITVILEKLNSALRETDFIASESATKYFIVLPETDYFGSLMTMRKIESNLTDSLIIKEGLDILPISVKMSSSSFPKDGTTAKKILKALSARLEFAKNSLIEKLQIDIKHSSFWDILTQMIGSEKDYSSDSDSKKGSYKINRMMDSNNDKGELKFSLFHPHIITQLEDIILNEIAITTDYKGVLYIGNSSIEHTLEQLKSLPDIERSNSRISLITRQCEKEVLFPNITYIFSSDHLILDYYFIVYLSEKYAYGLFAKKNEEGQLYGFHTSDSIFVETLIVKLQNHYMLQEQL